MLVAEYIEEFTCLSQYAPHLVSTEQARVKCFVQGLVTPLFKSVQPQVKNLTFTKVVDLTEMLKGRNLEFREFKKPRTETSAHARTMQKPSASIFKPANSQASVAQPYRRSSAPSQSVQSCHVCQRNHSGPCRKGSNACFQRGKEGHMKKECPTLNTFSGANCPQASVVASYAPPPSKRRIRGGTARVAAMGRGRGQMGHGQGQQGRGNARIYAMTRHDAQGSNAVITGMLRVGSNFAFALFDTGSMHSYVSPYFSVRFGLKPELLDILFTVEVPSRDP